MVLQADQVDVRFMDVQCLGWLFALFGRHVAQEYRLLFSNFLKRFGDKVVEVCIGVVRRAIMGLEANPFGVKNFKCSCLSYKLPFLLGLLTKNRTTLLVLEHILWP